jgi:L-threonylcarbamoyladenylate synthase
LRPIRGPEPAALWRLGEPLEALVERVRRGGILCVPTESSYGVAVDPRNEEAVERIFELKRRDGRKPLPVVIANPSQLALLGIAPEQPAVAAVRGLWPAALSVVLATDRPLPAAAGARSLAVRVPDHPLLLSVLAAVGPLTATSANPSGEPPLLDPHEVAAWAAGLDACVVNGGLLPGGPPSTLVEPTPSGWRVLRAGRVAADRLPPYPPVVPSEEATR